MSLLAPDHTSVRSWLAAAERGEFAEKATARDGNFIGEEFPTGTFVQPGWGGYGAAGNWGKLRALLPGSDYDYERAAGSSWRCGAVAACLRVLKINFAQPQLEVRERTTGGETPQPILGQPLVKLCDRPNEYYDRYAFWGAFCLSAVCDGNAYAIKVRSRARIPVELWYIPHWMMRPCWPTDGKTYISHYEYRPGNGHIYIVPREDVIHYRHGGIDPQNDRLGLADLKAGLRAVCGMNDADGYIASILRNGGVPTVTIRPVKDIGRAPTKEQADDMKRQYRERLTGEHRGDPFIATGPFEVVPLGFSPEQLALDKIPARMEDQICALIGVNPMVAGLTSGAQHKTYANAKESRRGLYEDLIYPMQDAVATCLEIHLLSDPGMGNPDTQEIGWNYKGIACLQEDQDLIWTRAGNAFQRDKMIMRSQAKELVGLPWDKEDEIYATDVVPARDVMANDTAKETAKAKLDKLDETTDETDDTEGVAPGIVDSAEDETGSGGKDKPADEKSLTITTAVISDEDVTRALRIIDEVERRLKAG